MSQCFLESHYALPRPASKQVKAHPYYHPEIFTDTTLGLSMVLNHQPCQHRADTDHNKVSAWLPLLLKAVQLYAVVLHWVVNTEVGHRQKYIEKVSMKSKTIATTYMKISEPAYSQITGIIKYFSH